MAFGFSPNYIRNYNSGNSDSKTILIAAIEGAKRLNWELGFVSDSGFIAYTNFSLRSWSEEITVSIKEGTVEIKSQCTGSQLFDMGKNRENVEKLMEAIGEEKSVLTQQEVEEKYSELQKSFPSTDIDILEQPPATPGSRIKNFLSIFKPVEGYTVTPILISVNILIFILMLLSGVHFLLPENNSLLEWGANFRPLTTGGQWWRLFTSFFVHIGIFHLLFNMYALLYVGILLEPFLGKTRFLAAYVISGIAASVSSIWWHELTISAGASGAIFGLYGVFLALLTTRLTHKTVKKALFASIAVFVAYNLLNGIKAGSGIDNAAHLGGLITGLIIGYAFVPSLKDFDNREVKFLSIGLLTTVLTIFSFSVFTHVSNDVGKYQEEMHRFSSMEFMALDVLNSQDTSRAKLLSEIEEIGIFYWKENIKLVESFDRFKLPDAIKEKNEKLKEYCRLRLRSYEIISRAIREDTDEYDNEIRQYFTKADAIATELAGKK